MKRIIGILCGLFFFLFSFAQETFQKGNLYLFPWRYIVVSFVASRGDET